MWQVDWENYRKNKKQQNNKSSKEQIKQSPTISKHPNKKSAPRSDSPREDFAHVRNFLRDPKNRQSSSPSIRTIMTTATKVKYFCVNKI